VNMGLPTDLSWYKLLADQGSFIGGVFALAAGTAAYLAGRVQANATRQAADRQIAAATRKDRLQAHCVVVGIYPELLAVRVTYERALKIINEEFPKAKALGSAILTAQIVALIRSARIKLPPLLVRSIEQFYLLDDAGPTVLQLVAIVLQYNDLVNTLTEQISDDVDSFDPPDHAQALSGQLQAIGQLLNEADRLLIPIHDEATRQPT
jgi:hypothetical protein